MECIYAVGKGYVGVGHLDINGPGGLSIVNGGKMKLERDVSVIE